MADLTVKSKFFAMEDVVEVSDEDISKHFPVKLEVSNIATLTNEDLDSLKAGDIVAKKTGNQLHAYIVSYKGEGENEGICLTYTDASIVETVSYDRTESGWAYNSTDITPIAEPLMENIVDANGNKRFVEIDGQLIISQTGVTITYCKASLSGTHLMMVVAGTIANGTALATNERVCYFALPSYVKDKIKPVWATNNIERKEVVFVGEDWSTQKTDFILALSGTGINIRTLSSTITASADRAFRVQFDLLIDSD